MSRRIEKKYSVHSHKFIAESPQERMTPWAALRIYGVTAAALLSGRARVTGTQGALWALGSAAGPPKALHQRGNWDQGGQGKYCQGWGAGLSKLASSTSLQGVHYSLHCMGTMQVITYIYCLGRISESPRDNISRSMMFSECMKQKIQDIIPNSLQVM